MKPKLTSKNKDFGFTLIELLTVIAIIVVLAGIMIPVVSRARAAGKKAKCISNLRNIGTAFLLYAGDHRNILPNPFFTTQGAVDKYIESQGQDLTGIIQWWRKESIGGYLLDGMTTGAAKTVFNCPSNDNATNNFDYCMNREVAFLNINRLSVDTIIVTENRGEGGEIAFNSTDQFEKIGYWHPKTSNGKQGLESNGRANTLFIDGHVATLPSQAIKDKSHVNL